MKRERRRMRVGMVVALLLLGGGCSREADPAAGPASAALPEVAYYPDASQRESMSQAMGPLGGNLVQLATSDDFDTVLAYYTGALAGLGAESISHTLPGGRQAALSLTRGDQRLTIAIQEFVDEGAVHITHMRLGR
ncbi:MAG: hypothetical protein HKP30_11535 [Myxococcales bacterium]|nr:hypothetical protein [Myxococcales bacterium]